MDTTLLQYTHSSLYFCKIIFIDYYLYSTTILITQELLILEFRFRYTNIFEKIAC